MPTLAPNLLPAPAHQIYVWPPVGAENLDRLQAGLTQMPGLQETALDIISNDQRSVVAVPKGVIESVGNEPAAAVLEGVTQVARTLGRQEARFGRSGLLLLVGLRQLPSDEDIAILTEHNFTQRDHQNRGQRLPHPIVNADGSVTLTFGRRASSKHDVLSLMRTTLKDKVAPQLGGLVTSDAVVHLRNIREASLFSARAVASI